MSANQMHLALARVLAAAAWADGRVEPEEANAIKRFMLRFHLDKDDVNEVAALLETPVTRSQAEALTDAFLKTVSSDADRRLLLETLEEVVAADGVVGEDEERLLLGIREAVESHSVVGILLDRVRGLFSLGGLRLPSKRRSDLADVLQRRLRDRVREKLAELSAEVAADAERLNHAVLFGALLQKVAFADGSLSPEEADKVAQLLAVDFDYQEDEIAAIRATLEEQVTAEVDLQRLATEFGRVADQAQRMELLHALFMVASADRTITDDEVDEIRRIADYLWIERREFNEVRLRWVKGKGEESDG